LTLDLAARRADISPRTLHRWMAKGRAQKTGQYVAFCHLIDQAEADGAAELMGSIRRAAMGTSREIPCPECQAVIPMPPTAAQWRAAKWGLERRYGYTSKGAARRNPLWDSEADSDTDASPIGFMASQLEALKRLVREAESSGSYQAAAALRRQMVDVHSKLMVMRQSGDPELEDVDEEEYLRQFREAVEEWPESYLDVVLDVYKARHRVSLVTVIEGGKS